MTTIISIANEKGGVAKTTTAITLGAALAETGMEVLLVDLDAQANLSLAFGIDGIQSQPNMANVLLAATPAHNAIRKTAVPHLSIIPSNAELGLAERFLPARQTYETILKDVFRETTWEYDYIIIDCPPFLGALTYIALMTSNLIILPTQAEFFSINALRNMMRLIRRIRTQGNPQLTYRLLLTMFDRRNRIHRSMSEQLRAMFGCGILETFIETDTKLRESPLAGMPVLYHAPKSRSALQYRALAQEILTHVQKTTA